MVFLLILVKRAWELQPTKIVIYVEQIVVQLKCDGAVKKSKKLSTEKKLKSILKIPHMNIDRLFSHTLKFKYLRFAFVK